MAGEEVEKPEALDNESCEDKFEELAPDVTPAEKKKNILERWGITIDELTELVDQNGSLRGMMLGYIAEPMVKKLYFEKGKPAQYLGKHDDHNRMSKGDLLVRYKGTDFDIEVKSLQTKHNTFRDGVWYGKAQVDASDRRIVPMPDGKDLNTTNLIYNEFDILAINLFTFENKWEFVFCKNKDLPCSRYKKYSEEQRKALIATLVAVEYPPQKGSIFTTDPYKLMDELLKEWARGGRPPRPHYKKVEKKKKGKKAEEAAAAGEGSTPPKKGRRKKAASAAAEPLLLEGAFDDTPSRS